MNYYMATFDFTTMRGNELRARSGQVVLQSELLLDEFIEEPEVIKQLCVNFVLDRKPKWNILMLDVKAVTKHKLK